jgi:hypothetical protein
LGGEPVIGRLGQRPHMSTPAPLCAAPLAKEPSYV